MNEFKLIKKFFFPLTNSHKFSQNLSDDVAIMQLKKNEKLIVSKDISSENTHFLLKDGGFKIASKLLLTNISDIASSGAKPLCYMLGFSKNSRLNNEFYSEFSRGLKSVQNKFNIFLMGGDTIFSEQLFFSITVFGIAKKGKILSRGSAKSGDLIYVSGTIGDAGLGLIESKNSNKKNYSKFLLNRHYFPTPRVSLGQSLISKNLSNCAIDVSDGLLADLQHICESSNLSADIFFDKIPISNSAKKFLKDNQSKNPLDLLNSGDDYELIFASKPENHEEILKLSKTLKIKITKIGNFKNSKKNLVNLYSDSQKINSKNLIKITKLGYEH